MTQKKNEQISQTHQQVGGKLLNFIRKQVDSIEDAEDIYQDVIAQLTERWDWTTPIEQIGSWLYRVARNKIIDRFRKKKEQVYDSSDEQSIVRSQSANVESGTDLLWKSDVLNELSEALEELPKEQRDVFIENEINGKSFKELSAESGIPINTLISRKRYAVLHLRQELEDVYAEIFYN